MSFFNVQFVIFLTGKNKFVDATIKIIDLKPFKRLLICANFQLRFFLFYFFGGILQYMSVDNLRPYY